MPLRAPANGRPDGFVSIRHLGPGTLPGIEVHAVVPPACALVPKTRAFLDLLSAWFATHRESA